MIPDDPGCYLFRDRDGSVIYVGKAKNLKKRVSSYFRKHGQDRKTEIMTGKIADIEVIATSNEVEAYILENSLIKKHLPRYNIDLKDAKTYAYIRLTDEPFPRIMIARSTSEPGSYFGPFVSARERDYVLSVVKRVFRLRSCRRMTKRACLRYHIGSCSAPCKGLITEEEYGKQVRKAESVLRGKSREIIAGLREEMAGYAAGEEYELAMDRRDQISAVEHLAGRQHVDRQKDHDEEIINYITADGRVCLMLFHVDRGTITEKQEYLFDASDNILEEFMIRYYADNMPPKEIIIPHNPGEALADYLSGIRGNRVLLTVPKKGTKKELLDLVSRNIEISFTGEKKRLEALAKALHLPEPPQVIECFDISHLHGTAMVGSMVRFTHGRPDKQHYRRFRIRSVEGIDDYASINEVVYRRYSRLKKEESRLPDLVIIDGGPGQLGAAREALKALEIRLPVISIAKRLEEIYLPGRKAPLDIPKNESASLLIQEIRDEAHRFAINYNRLLRSREMKE